MTEPDSPLWAAISELRRFYRESDRWRENLEREDANWERLSASWNAIEDAELALEHALVQWSGHTELGARYLAIYGALQALYVQQDAVMELVRFLGGDLDRKNKPALPTRVQEIRNARNWSIGHPAERAGHLVMGRVLLPAPQLTVFIPAQRSDQIQVRTVDVDVPGWVTAQRRLLADLLHEAIDKLQRLEEEHRMKHRNEPLRPFAASVEAEAAGIGSDLDKGDSESGGMLEFHCEQAEKALGKLEDAFKARGEFVAGNTRIGHVWTHARFALQVLRERFGRAHLRDPARLHARAYHALFERCAAILRREADAIDKRYGVASNDAGESV